MKFTITIPSAEKSGYETRVVVEADDWTNAMSAALRSIGDTIQNVIADVQPDGTIHVTDGETGRVIQVEPHERAAAKGAAPEADEDVDLDQIREELAQSSTRTAAHLDVRGTDTAELRKETDGAKIVKTETQRSGHHPAPKPSTEKKFADTISESLIESVFMRAASIHDDDRSIEDAVDYVLDMSMNLIPSESGSILFFDDYGQELYFAAARGPKSDGVLDIRVPAQGSVAGYSGRNGMAIAITDAQADARHYDGVAKAVGYATKTMICAPVEHQGRSYGCIQLINRYGGQHFEKEEVHALSYIAKQFAEYLHGYIMRREKLDD